jgi:hypothetical protein
LSLTVLVNLLDLAKSYYCLPQPFFWWGLKDCGILFPERAIQIRGKVVLLHLKIIKRRRIMQCHDIITI